MKKSIVFETKEGVYVGLGYFNIIVAQLSHRTHLEADEVTQVSIAVVKYFINEGRKIVAVEEFYVALNQALSVLASQKTPQPEQPPAFQKKTKPTLPTSGAVFLWLNLNIEVVYLPH